MWERQNLMKNLGRTQVKISTKSFLQKKAKERKFNKKEINRGKGWMLSEMILSCDM